MAIVSLIVTVINFYPVQTIKLFDRTIIFLNLSIEIASFEALMVGNKKRM